MRHDEDSPASTYKASGKRWIYMIVGMAINFSNGNTWITFASITFYTNAFYENNSATTAFNAIFMVLSVFVGPLAIWSSDKFGLAKAYHIGIWSNFVGNVLRFIGSTSWVPAHNRFLIAFIGQTVAAFAQPFILFLPTKLASFWFKENEQLTAIMLVSMSNPLGIALMYSFAPIIVNKDHPVAFPLLNGICLAGATITALLSVFITSSEPKTPVSAAKAKSDIVPSFMAGVKRCFTSPRFMLLAITIGGGIGAFSALYNNLQPALCAMGYSPAFNGAMGTVLIVAGLVGTYVSGTIAERTGEVELVMKMCFGSAGLAAASLSIALNFENQEAWIATSICLFGFFGFSIYPLGLENAIETAFPVAEATPTGILMIVGQLEGVAFVAITTALQQSPSAHILGIQTCAQNNSEVKTVSNWSNPFLAWLAIVVILIMIFIMLFRPENNKTAYEKENRERISLTAKEDNGIDL